MRRPLRIGGALILGILLILVAFYVAKPKEPLPSGEIVTVPMEPQDSLEIQDLDDNGIADWKEGLEGLGFETINTPPVQASNEQYEEYVPPTTLTGRFSVAFMQDYLGGKMSGESFVNPEAFISDAVEAVDRSIEPKKYSRLELTVIEATNESLYDYGNELVEILLSHPFPPEGREVLEIVQNSLTQEAPEILDELLPLQNAYAGVIDDMVQMNVPSELAELHVDLLNRNEKVHADFVGMQQIFTDPLYGLAHIKNYSNDVSSAADIVSSMLDILTKNGIVYTKEDLGSILYIFDI